MSNFQTLDVLALDSVTGGKATSSSSSELTSQLTALQSSITDLGKNQKKGGLFGNPTNAVLFAMVAMKNREQSSPNVVLVR
ncbi:MAG: hypothetical protein AB7T06_21905 [Kofleriaceae bacterium]